AMTRVMVVLVALVALACEPVVPAAEADSWSFEGFQVYSYVPPEPVGIVYVFHGSNGSAEIANRIETTDQLNELVERGYGWVATESTLRTGNKRWEVNDPSLVTNPDLARLTRLHDELIDDTGVAADTPIFGIGMSNGARMVTLFGQAFADNGYPVAAVAPFMGQLAGPVRSAGGLTVPAFWVIAENDGVVPNTAITADHQQQVALGVPTRLHTKVEEPLLSARFTRIPAIDEIEAEAIRQALEDTGAWDAGGTRVLGIAETLTLVSQLTLPPSFGATASQVRNQIEALLAVHQFVGIFRTGVGNFFDAQLP
ncbi:MAG: hypothetical protein ACR2QE_10885, partial [Acidimicrobiales bacterium]